MFYFFCSQKEGSWWWNWIDERGHKSVPAIVHMPSVVNSCEILSWIGVSIYIYIAQAFLWWVGWAYLYICASCFFPFVNVWLGDNVKNVTNQWIHNQILFFLVSLKKGSHKEKIKQQEKISNKLETQREIRKLRKEKAETRFYITTYIHLYFGSESFSWICQIAKKHSNTQMACATSENVLPVISG